MRTNHSPTLLSLIVGVALLGSGCATLVGRGPDPVHFTSNPSGASIRIDEKLAGTTPTTAVVDREARVVAFRKDGYEEAVRPVPRTVNPWIFGNVLFGGLIGIVVDTSTGNAQKAEGTVAVDLRPAPALADGRVQ